MDIGSCLHMIARLECEFEDRLTQKEQMLMATVTFTWKDSGRMVLAMRVLFVLLMRRVRSGIASSPFTDQSPADDKDVVSSLIQLIS